METESDSKAAWWVLGLERPEVVTPMLGGGT
jgi:hypothetical protein